MRIALDVNWIAGQGGISTYIARLTEALGRVGGDHALVLVSYAASSAAVRAVAPAGATVVTLGTVQRALAKVGRSTWLSPLTTDALAGRVDVFHGLAFFLPAHRGSARRVITLHDLAGLRYPRWLPPYGALMMRIALARTARLADHVITHSEAIRAEAIEYLGLAPGRVTAVPLGVSAAYRPLSAEEAAPVLARHALTPGAYLCYAGDLGPRKNILRLLDAVARVRARRRDTPGLVLVGPAGWRSAEVMQRLGAAGGRYLGYVPAAELRALIAGSAAFCYLSLYEGFGLPLLDALACGVPSLASTAPALAEVAGGAALLVDPFDTDAIAAGISRLLDDSALRAELARRGVARARQFTWERTAAETLAVYAKTISA